MKKIFDFFFITIIILFILSGCSQNNVTEYYNNRTDFSGTQGYKNWYYLYSEDELITAKNMIYDFDMCTWRAPDPNCLIEYHIMHPGQLIQVIMAWKAPQNGNISYETILQRRPVSITGQGADGCFIYVAINDDTVLQSETYDGKDVDEHIIDGLYEIKKDEMIYFVLNCSGNYTFDQTSWEINIIYTYNK